MAAEFPNEDEPRLSLICPKCGAYMATIDFAGVSVDRCTNCAGLWFDYREAETLRAIPGAEEALDIGDPQIGVMLDVVRQILCPRCGAATERMVFDQQPDLSFECCPSCFGIFLDAGEFHDSAHVSIAERIARIWVFISA